jgi:hypothetical protein
MMKATERTVIGQYSHTHLWVLSAAPEKARGLHSEVSNLKRTSPAVSIEGHVFPGVSNVVLNLA